MKSVLEVARREFFKNLRDSKVLAFACPDLSKGKELVASNADVDNRASIEISNAVARKIVGETRVSKKLQAQTVGTKFEEHLAGFLTQTFMSLSHLRPGAWEIEHVRGRNKSEVARFEQYSHLADLAVFCSRFPELSAVLGNDYAISPDIVIARHPEPDARINAQENIVGDGVAEKSPLRRIVNSLPILHACVSCKFTIRSDRSQNSRSEALNLIRNRKGRTPHIVVVTAECLPSRLASLALGTGDIDCVYHIALPELVQAVRNDLFPDARDMLEVMISGRRLRDLTDLPLDLAV